MVWARLPQSGFVLVFNLFLSGHEQVVSAQLLALNRRSSCVHFFAGRVGLSDALVLLGRWMLVSVPGFGCE